MSHFESLLDHTCVISRATETENPFGSPAVSRSSQGTFRCRIEEKSERAYSDKQARFIVSTRLVALFAAGTDVRESDLLTSVTVDGSTDTRSFRVLHVLKRVGANGVVHHVSVEVEAI